ncbi:MAG: NAD(P)-dependent oxidoreductase [Rhodospirillaceae bacterium]
MKNIVLFKHPAPAFRAELQSGFDLVDFDLKLGDKNDPRCAEGRVLMTSGSYGAFADEIAALPSLGLICCVGTGYDRVDLDAAKARWIKVCHAAGTNAESVADHAFALLLAAVRDIVNFDAVARSGAWRGPEETRPTITGRPIGIIGMGGIGKGIARRAAASEMPVYYTARSAKSDLPYTFVADVKDLAEHVDFLVVSAPGGAETQHMINANVLAALGKDGYLVNIGRGSIVDTAALVHALKSGVIRGAGIDVYEDEPDIPDDLIALKNVVLTPHVGGMVDGIHAKSAVLIRKNIEAFFAGEPLVTPIPEMAE